MISTGYYSTSTEFIRDALRGKMREMEENRIEQIRALVAEGQKSLDRFGAIEINEDFENTLEKDISAAIQSNEPTPDYLIFKNEE
jgi:Arc/MetJ-type ribon-helix-helix transcriptional regulator